MELCEFHDTIYGKFEGQLYIFEYTWDSFRPIEFVGWDGSKFSPVDRKYKLDLFSPNYGYGSLEQKALCRKLVQETELENAREIKDPIQFWKWCGNAEAKWWRDRPCVFSSGCVSRDGQSWKKYLQYLNVRAKTLRRPFRGRVTKRLVPK
jgi:hypothetical protein